MNLLDVYNAHVKGEITEKEAAALFGITVRNLRFKITRYGMRLPTVLATLDKISRDQISRDNAAVAMGVQVREVNNLMAEFKVTRPIPEYVINQTLTEIKWEIRKKFAIEFIAGSCTIEEAAENAECTTRQIRRWVENLLKKHFEMPYKDLKKLALHKRQRLANEIEAAEGLEMAKVSIINAINRGEKSVEQEASERLAMLAARRIRRNARSKSTKVAQG